MRNRVVTNSKEVESLQIDPSHTLYRGTGCRACYDYGYKGRHGVYELMSVTPTLQKQIVASPDSFTLRETALKEGMVTLRHHVSALVKEGTTTPEEALRILS